MGKALNYGNFNTYPGVHENSGNHYAFNKMKVDLNPGFIKSDSDTFFKGNLMTGGYTYRKNSSMRKSRRRSSRRKKFRGGDFPLWGDLRSSLQVAQNNVANTHNTLAGKENLVSPLPWKDQYI